MNIGLILIAWLAITAITIAALIGCGIISVKIETGDEDDEEDDDDR